MRLDVNGDFLGGVGVVKSLIGVRDLVPRGDKLISH